MTDIEYDIAVCSWSMQPQHPADLIEKLRQVEIPAVQLALTPVAEQPDAWGDAIEVIQHAGVPIVSGMLATHGEDYSTLDSIKSTGGVRSDELWPANQNLAKRVAELAGHYGIDLVTFHAGFLPHDPDDSLYATMIERLRVVADLFAERNVNVAFETGQEDAATLSRVLVDLDRPNVGVNFDPANMILYGMGDPVDALRDLAQHVRQIHIKDAAPSDDPQEWGTEVPVGTGAVDWPSFFEIVNAMSPRPPLVIEREAGDDRLVDIATARDLVVRFLA